MSISEIWDKTKRLVEKNGWATMSVFASANAVPPAPNFTYSIGLARSGLPDIIVCGLPPSLAHALIADLAARLLQRPHSSQAQKLTLSEPILDLVQGKRAMLLEVATDVAAKHCLLAHQDAEDNGSSLQLWQLIWPDQHGLFPWENGVSPEVVAVQPLLGRSTYQ